MASHAGTCWILRVIVATIIAMVGMVMVIIGDVEDAEDDSLRNDNDGNYEEEKDHLNTQALLQDQDEIDRGWQS